MQLCFVSVHGPREPYFVDEPRINSNSNFFSTTILNMPSAFTWLILRFVYAHDAYIVLSVVLG
jgi:hypothetical protein